MRAFVLRDYGAAPQIEEFSDPRPVPGLLEAEVLAAGLNPVDVAIAEGHLGTANPVPLVLGNEAVVALDGRAVYSHRARPPFGTFAERTLVDPREVIEVPAEMDPATVLIAGISGQPAWIPLETTARLQPGETVIVLGATGAAGQVATQAAKLLGAGWVVAAGRDEATLESLRGRGADEIVVLGDDGTDEDVAALLDASRGGADLVYDPLWGPPFVAALRATKPGGRTVGVGRSAGRLAATIPYLALRGKTMLTYRNGEAPHEVVVAAFNRMLTHAAAGELVVDIEEFPLEQATRAWQLQHGAPHRKLVLRPS
ncbi:quinone oxidoreductase family protein [Nocardia aurantiaca]|uniref:Zinc-binding dehydrogenase n=1 Tax=Nocardia aurantiaca TaxID=2675850 RepID=A0A6I3L7Y0_9NOCA|nr:zinc-binding alcohol dehydrogenase family protein [Nocardia aurantiaca]MTE16824.1 zinc-binding dehydrogenase [Nocardia aurantiaca]